MIDEHAPHQTCGDAEKVCAILPPHLSRVDQPNERLVDEGRRLQRVTQSFAGHVDAGQAAQFGLDQRDEVFQRGLVAAAPRPQQRSDR